MFDKVPGSASLTHNNEGNNTIQQISDNCVHDWYRFVLAFPDHLVSELITRFNIRRGHTVLDPFVGTGTTLVECKKEGIDSIGVDANPVTAFASKVKTTWTIDVSEFERRKREFLLFLESTVESGRFGLDAPPDQLSFDSILPRTTLPDIDPVDLERVKQIIPKDAMSDLPLRKVLVAKQELQTWPDDSITDIFKLILASVAVQKMSNVGFGPEIYVKRKKLQDANLFIPLAHALNKVQDDLAAVQQIPNPGYTAVYHGDAREVSRYASQGQVDFVITSPPYPNEKDYTRITRLELALLDFTTDRKELRRVKQDMLRSHTRNIYKDDDDVAYVADISEIQTLAEEIERRRVERGATSGFEKLYHRVVTEYFGGMYRVLDQLQQVLKPGGKIALVVGDQMSFFQVHIPTAKLLSIVAQRKLPYTEVETLTWRTRLATATQLDIEEHILILEHSPSKRNYPVPDTIHQGDTVTQPNRYSRIIEAIFHKYYQPGDEEVSFSRVDIETAAKELNIRLPKNIGDVVYSFRYRAELPSNIRSTAPENYEWIIRPAGRAKYRFVLAAAAKIEHSPLLAETKVLNSTPGIIDKYALDDEQAILAKIRYNRLIDIFTGLTCYSLQSHWRTTVPSLGQVEIDEIYIGVDKRGAHYVLPVEAKGRRDQIGVVQIEQDFAVCAAKFPDLTCIPVAAQLIEDDIIALFAFEQTGESVAISSEKKYRLVAPTELSPEELERYRQRTD